MTDQTDQKALVPDAVPASVISDILERNPELHGIGTYEYGWFDKNDVGANAKRGLDEDVVRDGLSENLDFQYVRDDLLGLAIDIWVNERNVVVASDDIPQS